MAELFIARCEHDTQVPNSKYLSGKCDSCGDWIPFCSECHSDDFGLSVSCKMCEELFEVSADRESCQVSNCDVLNVEDASICQVCEDGFYLLGGKCLEFCPKGSYALKGKCIENCPSSHNSTKFFDKVTERCIMCEDRIPGCLSCSQDKNNLLTCQKCDYKLFPTFDQLECTPCKETWQYWDGDNCVGCSDIFPFCKHCTFRDHDFKCAECFGDDSVSFLPSDLPDGAPTACGCDASEFMFTYPTLVFDPESFFCAPCSWGVDNCALCPDEGYTCTECENGYFEDEDGQCTKDPCRSRDEYGRCTECNL